MSHRISLTQREFLKEWIRDPRAAAQSFIRAMKDSGEPVPEIRRLNVGDVLLEQNVENDRLYMVITGRVVLVSSDVNGRTVPVTRIRPGSLLGVMSFFTGQPTLTSALVELPTEVLVLTREDVEAFTRSQSVIAPLARQMITANLLERYHQVVELNLQLETVNESLKTALHDLQAAHNRLVHQEKMATLGQLVAGIAHEINNPAAALQGAIRNLSEVLPGLLSTEPVVRFLTYGQESASLAYSASAEDRNRVRSDFPDLSPSEQRLVLGMDAAIRAEFIRLPQSQRSRALQLFDAGQLMRGATSSSTRIANLVKSLKSYSRQDSGETLDIQIQDGLQDTLHILANRLKRVEVTVDADSVPPVWGNTAELNQVWTNLIVNACDAMGDEGRLRIVIREVDGCVQVDIHDSGTGISPEHMPHLFDAHFTTRNSSGNFGLGLGLAITRDIVVKHNGTIAPGKSDVLPGAKFTVRIPAKAVQQ
jgi:signal transduction histidine kinase